MPRNVDRELREGETRILQGITVLSDSAGPSHETGGGNARCEMVQNDDGTAYLDLLRYTRATRGFSDRRRVPLPGETFLALADALFSAVASDDATVARRRAAVASGRYIHCAKCNRERERDDGWKGCPVCHGKGIAPVARIAAWERDSAAPAARAIEVPWNPSAAEGDEVELPSLWLDIRAVIDGDGDAPALVNIAAIPTATGPVKLAVVPMDGGGPEVQTLTMPRETYLALSAALVSCVGADDEADDSIKMTD